MDGGCQRLSEAILGRGPAGRPVQLLKPVNFQAGSKHISWIGGYVSHSLCQLVDQPRMAGQPVDTFGRLSKVEPERLPTVSVDHRNATCRPAALLVAALPHCHQVAMSEAIQASSPPDGSSGSTTSGHRRPAMAFRTHLETPQAAGCLLAAAVRSQPSWQHR